MTKAICFTLSIFSYFNAYSGIIINCPEDKVVHIFELDLDYNSYGDPIVQSTENYSLDKEISLVDNACLERYALIEYTAENDAGESSSCTQRIDVELAQLNDIVLPSDVDFNSISLEEAQSHKLTFPYQWEYMQGGASNITAAYNDQIIPPVNGNRLLKILRTWTFIDWCTSKTIEHTHVITIHDYEVNNTTPLFSVETCSGKYVDVEEIELRTDQPNFQLDFSNCELMGSDITAYVNCIAEQNELEPDSHLFLNVYAEGEYLNGVSTLDIVISQRHILGIMPFEDPCEPIAADVNSDGRVTALDLLLMRRLILGISAGFEKSPVWKVVNTKYLEDNASDEEKDLKFRKDEFPLQKIELVAIKKGDVNGTAN